MTPLSKTLVAAAALAAMATSAFSQVPWEFNPGMAYMYSGPGKMTAMVMASTSKNHEAMMKDAKKVPENTVFFMDGGQLFSVSGALDPTGNFYRPRSDRYYLGAISRPLAGGFHRKMIQCRKNPITLPRDAAA